MFTIAVTGNVAAGKSTVVRWFGEWGADVIDADELARDTQRPGGETLAAIAHRFGNGVLTADGSLDRDALRQVVLADPDALAALNAIVHPAVRRRRDALARDAERRGTRILVNDIPLLFEVLDPDDFDLVLLVDAPAALRRTRLIEHRGMPPAEADRLIAAQLPSDLKRARSDIVIDNDGTVEELHRKARLAWQVVERRAARQTRGTRSPRGS